MLVDLQIDQPLPLESLSASELHANIDAVLNGHLPGFVIAASMPDAFTQSTACAQKIGLVGGVNSTTVTFNYDHTSDHLTAHDAPDPEEWEDLGITPLHADGEEGERMLSINQALVGAYDIMIFGRGPKIASDMPIELWDGLQNENMGVLLSGQVDPEMLATRATRLAVQAGQTIVFNPSQPHMGITRRAPRRANATFFQAPLQ